MKIDSKVLVYRIMVSSLMLVMILNILGLLFNNITAETKMAKIHYEYIEDKNLSKEEHEKLKKDFKELKA